MRKPDFERCTAEATKLLYVQNVSDRILSVQDLTYDKCIIFDSIQNYSKLIKKPREMFLSKNKQVLREGCTLCDWESDCHIVLYNEDVTYFEHLNWTLGHEIGHIYLGHKNDGDTEEIEAHYFASQLFMPEYTLFMMAHEYKRISVKDVVEIFGVSEEAASKRLQTMKKKTYFDSSKKAKEIWEVQRERVELYYKCKEAGTDYRYELEMLQFIKEEFEHEYPTAMYL